MNDLTIPAPRIVFCCPSMPGPPSREVQELLGGAHAAGYAVVENSMSPHDRARGYLARAALDTGAEWQVWVDDDMVARLDQAVALVGCAEASGFDILTGVYVCRHLASKGKLAFNFSPELGGEFTMGPEGGPYPIISCGMGFVAIHRRVFEKVDAPECEYGRAWFLPMVQGGQHLGEDRSFGVRCKMAGLQMYVDTRVLVGHRGTRVYRPEDFSG